MEPWPSRARRRLLPAWASGALRRWGGTPADFEPCRSSTRRGRSRELNSSGFSDINHLTHEDDGLRRGNEQLLLRRHAGDTPALRPQVIELLLDVTAGVDDLVLVARHDAPPGSRTSFGTFPFSVNTRRIA